MVRKRARLSPASPSHCRPRVCVALVTLAFVLIPHLGAARSDLAGYWSLDTAQPNDLLNLHHGTVTGAPQLVAGVVGNAYDFTNPQSWIPSQYVWLGPITLGGEFTVSAWVKLPFGAPTDDREIVAQRWAGGSAWQLMLRDRKAFFEVQGGAILQGAGPDLGDGAWHHLAGVLSASAGQVRLYVDGALVQTGGHNGSSSSVPVDTAIGWRPDGYGAFHGSIDEVAMFTVAKDAAGITALYSVGSGPDPDSDDDGVDAATDNCPDVANEDQTDTDEDGKGDACDLDDDNDGTLDVDDAFPLDADESADTDGDSVGDNSDAFPTDRTEWADNDGDNVGNNSDLFPDNPGESADADGDGVGDNSDAFPSNSAEWADADRDGVGDNADEFPNNPGESADADGDGVGDNSDAFPSNSAEWADADEDGVGNNADVNDQSNVEPSVRVGACTVRVDNRVMPNGLTFNDMIRAALSTGPNRGAGIKALAHLITQWQRAGLLTGRIHGLIMSCAS